MGVAGQATETTDIPLASLASPAFDEVGLRSLLSLYPLAISEETMNEMRNSPINGNVRKIIEEFLEELRENLDILEETLGIRLGEITYVKLWVDGGSRGNPGPGYGSWFIESPAESSKRDRKEFGWTTSNEAEYGALLAGLEHVASLGIELSDVDITVYTDSALVIGQIQGGWKVQAKNLWPLWDEARTKLAQFKAWRLVKRDRTDVQRILGH